MLKTTKLREILLEAHGPMTLDQLRAQVANPGEALQWLVDAGLVIITPQGFHALDGLGNPVQPGGVRKSEAAPQHVSTPGQDKGFRGSVTTPTMASKAAAGGSAPHRNGWVTAGQIPLLSKGNIRRAEKQNAARDAIFPQIVASVRSGVPINKAFASAGSKSWSHVRDHKPEEWKLIEQAQEEWKKEQEDLVKEFRRKLLLLIQVLGTPTIDQIFKKTQGWQNGKQYSKKSVGLVLRAMRAMGLADFVRTGKNENRWRAT